jgi:hypothetical protein
MNVSVDYAATNGTATVGTDFAGVTGTLRFNPGQTNKSVLIPLLDDQLDEFTETVLVKLTNPTNAVLATPSQSTLDLLDDDPPTVNFTATQLVAQDTDGSVMLNVRLTKPYSQLIVVDFATSGGTATPGQDYVAASDSLLFSVGQTNKTILLTLLPDSGREGDETFNVVLSGFVNVTPGDGTVATIRIHDNQPGSAPQVGNATRTAQGFSFRITGEAGQQVAIEAATVLGDWQTLATLTNTSGTLNYTDTTAAGPTARFFRVRVVP